MYLSLEVKAEVFHVSRRPSHELAGKLQCLSRILEFLFTLLKAFDHLIAETKSSIS
jgi:hypothetical protein